MRFAPSPAAAGSPQCFGRCSPGSGSRGGEAPRGGSLVAIGQDERGVPLSLELAPLRLVRELVIARDAVSGLYERGEREMAGIGVHLLDSSQVVERLAARESTFS